MDTVLSVCAGLIVINEADNRVRLIHYTVQNYLDRIQARLFPNDSTEITMTCITYLSFDIFSQDIHDPMGLFHQNSLLDYAVEFCLIHARGRPESDIKDTILSFLAKSTGCYEKRRKYAHPLWIAAAFQLNEICGDLIKGDSGAAMLQEAALEGLTDMVEILLNNGVSPDANWTGNKQEYDSALQAASVRGHEKIIRLLLRHGADIDLPGHIGTALQMAAFFGHRESVSLLLSRGANVNVEGGWYGTALIAATFRDYDIVRMLLDHGADVSAKSGRFGTALDAASTAGRLAIYILLIERGARGNKAFTGATGSPHSFDGTPCPGSNADTTQHQCFKKAFSVTAPMQSRPLSGTDWRASFTRYVHSMPLDWQISGT
ncbi:ankyrin repeat-containing domain protein [Mycena vulgaris]|nr:ankyrin repeat-containing domain protein [Mycena vulgaris]